MSSTQTQFSGSLGGGGAELRQETSVEKMDSRLLWRTAASPVSKTGARAGEKAVGGRTGFLSGRHQEGGGQRKL